MNLHHSEEQRPDIDEIESGPDPDSAEDWFKRGLQFAQLGFPDRATGAFQEAAWLDPDNVQVHFNMGTANLSLGYFEEAIVNLTRTIELAPEMADAYGNRAVAYTAIGDDDRADVDVKKAIELGAPPDGIATVLEYVKSRRKPT